MTDTTIRPDGYVVLGEFVTSGGYDWAGCGLFEKDGAFFFGVDWGCSCDWWDAEYGMFELQPVASRADAVELAKKHFSDDEVVTIAERFLT